MVLVTSTITGRRPDISLLVEAMLLQDLLLVSSTVVSLIKRIAMKDYLKVK